MATSFEQKCAILADIWVTCRNAEARSRVELKFGPDFDLDDLEFDEWISWNDLGLPLAYAIAENIVDATDRSQSYIEEAWEALADLLQMDPDKTYTTKEKMFLKAGSL